MYSTCMLSIDISSTSLASWYLSSSAGSTSNGHTIDRFFLTPFEGFNNRTYTECLLNSIHTFECLNQRAACPAVSVQYIMPLGHSIICSKFIPTPASCTVSIWISIHVSFHWGRLMVLKIIHFALQAKRVNSGTPAPLLLLQNKIKAGHL